MNKIYLNIIIYTLVSLGCGGHGGGNQENKNSESQVISDNNTKSNNDVTTNNQIQDNESDELSFIEDNGSEQNVSTLFQRDEILQIINKNKNTPEFNSIQPFNEGYTFENCEKYYTSLFKEPKINENILFADFDFDNHFSLINTLEIPAYQNFSKGIISTDYHSSTQPIIQTVKDLNQDGFDDIFITFHEAYTKPIILYSQGNGEFYQIEIPHNIRMVREVSTADFNNDGWLDIYAHTAPHEWKNTEFEIYGTNESDFLLISKENGNNFDVITLEDLTFSNNHQGAVADFNSDGYTDILSHSSNIEGDKFLIYGGESLIFSKGENKLPSMFNNLHYFDAEAIDLNGDTLQDVIISEIIWDNEISDLKEKDLYTILFNKNSSLENSALLKFGNHWITEQSWNYFKDFTNCLTKSGWGTLYGTSISGGEMLIEDFDQDGDKDILVSFTLDAHFEQNILSQRTFFMKIFKNSDNGKEFIEDVEMIPFQQINRVWTQPNLRLQNVFFVDLNNDEKKDILLQGIGLTHNKLNWKVFPKIYLNQNNFFIPINNDSAGDLHHKDQPSPIDFNGDGKIDLMTTKWDKNSYKLFLYQNKN